MRPSFWDRACFYAYCYLMPGRYLWSPLGMWLLRRAGNYAYWDNEIFNGRGTE